MSIAPPRDRPAKIDPVLAENEDDRQGGKPNPSPSFSSNRWERLRKAITSEATVCIALGLAAAFLAVAGSSLVFPHLSDNNDEATYLIQAGALRQGHLFPPAPENWESFLPSLSVWMDGRFVPKYTPVHAGIIALSDLVFGTQRAALALIAGVAVITCYLLAKEVLPNRSQATVGAVFFGLSPLVLIQSATFLSYLSALALLQGFAAALLAGVRRGSHRLLFFSGVLAGTAFFARPYDALLFGAPFALWIACLYRKAGRELATKCLWIAGGAALPLAAMLAYFHASTGGWFDTPFNLTHPSDMLGFGRRQMYEGSRPIFYTLGLAWEGLNGQLKLMSFWCFGGLALAGLAAMGARQIQWRQPGRWLALVSITFPLGYFFFWGSVGSIRWGAPSRIGPFYYLPMVTPIAILGAAGLCRLWIKARKVAALSVLAMLLVSVSTVGRAIQYNKAYTQKRIALYGPLLGRPLNNALIFLPRVNSRPRLTHPFALARNSSFSEEVLWALDRGTRANQRVLAEFPERVPYRLVITGKRDRQVGSKLEVNFKTRLEPIPSNS